MIGWRQCMELWIYCFCEVLNWMRETFSPANFSLMDGNNQKSLAAKSGFRFKHESTIKLSTLCHSFFSDTAPVYQSDLPHVYSPARQLHSSSDSRTLGNLYKRLKHLDIARFLKPLRLSQILCLVKLDTFSQSLHLLLPWNLICSNPTSASFF